MKGIIFNIAELFIVTNHGEEVFDEIISSCNLLTTEPFVGPGTYADEDMLEIIRVSTEKLNVSADTLMQELGRFSFSQLYKRYPNFVTPYDDAKTFLMTVDGIIHVEVRKLYKGTQLPVFQYKDISENELLIIYFSKRKLYSFMGGLINGVADHFNVKISQENEIFVEDGNELCKYHLKFHK
jgi:hypothetical protein